MKGKESIFKSGEKNGVYRKPDNTFEVIDYLNAPTEEFPLNPPLEMGELCKIYPGNVIVAAGAKSAGKTGFLLNLVKLKMNRESRIMVDDFYLVAKKILAIHLKLKDGIAIVGLQKDPDRDYRRGGTFSTEKSRLYISWDQNRIKIVDAKAWRDNTRNPRGLIKNFRLIKVCNFSPADDWHTQEDEEAKNREEEGEKKTKS